MAQARTRVSKPDQSTDDDSPFDPKIIDLASIEVTITVGEIYHKVWLELED